MMVRAVCRALAAAGTTVLLCATFGASAAPAGTLYVKSCIAGDAGAAFASQGSGDFIEDDKCPSGKFQIANDSFFAVGGGGGQWHTITPPAIEITRVTTLYNQVLVDPKLYPQGYQASYFWHGGSQRIAAASYCCGGMDYAYGINRDIPASRYFGWQVTCNPGPANLVQCNAPSQGQLLDVGGVVLVGTENTGPSFLAFPNSNLYYQQGRYVRGAGWPINLDASDDSGVCDEWATVDGRLAASVTHLTPNEGRWLQCGAARTREMPGTFDTTALANGLHGLRFFARNAAGVVSTSATAPVHVDNSPVTLTLSGPTDAPSTAGTQFVTATATAGPSGVAGIDCSEDGAPYTWQPSWSVRIAFRGVGEHRLTCFAQNKAIDAHGIRASSARQRWTLKIGQPTVLAIGFDRTVRGLRCHRTRARNGSRRRLIRCHRSRRFADDMTRRVAHGRAVNVSGWLGTSTDAALGGEAVQVLSAPDNGLGRFRTAAMTVTARNGSWTARLPAGPSRLVVARFGGGPRTEHATSGQAHLIVPAKVTLLRVVPRRVPWGGTIHIVGRLSGGYLPPGGALLRLRIGVGGSYTTYGIEEHVTGRGRFATTYTFGAGEPAVHRSFWFQVASLPMGDYPYAPAASRRVSVEVGGHPRTRE